MIWEAKDRRKSTRGGLITSTGLHVLLLLLLGHLLRTGAANLESRAELTEISYIEAHYGEDVAAKVKLKAIPKRRSLVEDSGTGISTRSAVKPAKPEPGPPRPESKVEDVSAPDLAVPETPKELASAPQLTPKRPRQTPTTIVDANALRAQLQPASDEELASLSAELERPRQTFKPSDNGLVDRGKVIVVPDADLPLGAGGDTPTGRALAETDGSDLRALNRSGAGPRSQPSVAGLSGAGRGRASLEEGGSGLPAPPGGGGSDGKGRRTILDYGSGSGGGLRGRGGGGRLAETPKPPSVVGDDKGSARSEIAEAEPTELESQGARMTISGQIQGRKILKSVAPDYTAQARRKGWEGVVAVHFTVLADGRVKDNVYFEQTSAHRDLNRAAMDAIKQFRFAPLPQDQAAVEQWGVITIVFRLN